MEKAILSHLRDSCNIMIFLLRAISVHIIQIQEHSSIIFTTLEKSETDAILVSNLIYIIIHISLTSVMFAFVPATAEYL